MSKFSENLEYLSNMQLCNRKSGSDISWLKTMMEGKNKTIIYIIFTYI